MLFVCLISGNSLRHVVLDVVVINLVFVLVEAVRSEIVRHLRDGEIGVRHNHSTVEDDLGIRTDVANFVPNNLI